MVGEKEGHTLLGVFETSDNTRVCLQDTFPKRGNILDHIQIKLEAG